MATNLVVETLSAAAVTDLVMVMVVAAQVAASTVVRKGEFISNS
jgi:hypothetical protein